MDCTQFDFLGKCKSATWSPKNTMSGAGARKNWSRSTSKLGQGHQGPWLKSSLGLDCDRMLPKMFSNFRQETTMACDKVLKLGKKGAVAVAALSCENF